MLRFSSFLIALAALMVSAGALAQVPSSPTPAPAITPHLERLPSGAVRVTVPAPPAFVIDHDTLALTASRGWAVHPTWPVATTDALGRAIHPQTFTVDVPVEAQDPTRPLQVSLTFRICPAASPCELVPHTQTVTLPGTLTQPTLVIVGTTWCHYCQLLSAKLNAPTVQAFLVGWQVVHLDGDDDPDANTRMGVKGYPLLRVYAPGDLADTHHGTHSDGYPSNLLGYLKEPAPRKVSHTVASVP